MVVTMAAAGMLVLAAGCIQPPVSVPTFPHFNLQSSDLLIASGNPISITATFVNTAKANFTFQPSFSCSWLEAWIVVAGVKEVVAGQARPGIRPNDPCWATGELATIAPGHQVAWTFDWNGTYQSHDRGIWMTLREAHRIWVDFRGTGQAWMSSGNLTVAVSDNRPFPPVWAVAANPQVISQGGSASVRATFNNTAGREFFFLPTDVCRWVVATIMVGGTSHFVMASGFPNCDGMAGRRGVEPGNVIEWSFTWNGTYLDRYTKVWTPVTSDSSLAVDFEGSRMSWPSEGRVVMRFGG